MHSPESDPLSPLLHEVEARLEEQLAEACENTKASEETTGELIRLEETLSFAAKTAKEVVSLRRRMRERTHEDADEPAPDSGLGPGEFPGGLSGDQPPAAPA